MKENGKGWEEEAGKEEVEIRRKEGLREGWEGEKEGGMGGKKTKRRG